MKQEPSPKLFIVYLILIAVMFFAMGITIGYSIGNNKVNETESYNDFIMVEAPNLSYFVKNQTLASQMDEFDLELYDMAYSIIECESNWDATAQNKHSSAYGLGQFINGTWQYVENKWDMDLDRDDPEAQMYATIRLLKEEGYSHWIESSSCWDPEHKYINQ